MGCCKMIIEGLRECNKWDMTEDNTTTPHLQGLTVSNAISYLFPYLEVRNQKLLVVQCV